MDLPEVNIVVAITALAGIGGLVGYLVRPILAINGELRVEIEKLRGQAAVADRRIITLEELVTSRAAVDELAGYIADWRDEARRRDELIITSLKTISLKLGAAA